LLTEDGSKRVKIPQKEEIRLQPAWTVKGADCEVAPLVSRSKSPRFWPAETVTIQVNELPVRLSQETIAGPVGLSPGWTLYKR